MLTLNTALQLHFQIKPVKTWMNFYYAGSCLLNNPLEILQSNQPPHTFDGRRFLFRVKGMDGFKRSSKTELHLTISFEIYETFFIFTCSFVRLLDSILLATNEQSVYSTVPPFSSHTIYFIPIVSPSSSPLSLLFIIILTYHYILFALFPLDAL